MITVVGTKLGIVGASTEVTPFTTMPANFPGLTMAKPTARYVTDEAKALRARGAQIVVLTIHAGSECKNNDTADDLSTCDSNDEIFRVLDDVPKGLIDVVVAGHTHAAVAHRIDGAAVIESYSSGRAFGRVDIAMNGANVAGIAIHKPEIMCPLDSEGNPSPLSECHSPDYEGNKVVPDPAVQKIVDEALARTEKQRDESLGVNLSGPITKAYKTESLEGDWFGDLMLEARPDAQIALTNGGGLRADISSGELTYGKLFQAMPFDNRFALVTVLGKHVRRLVTSNLKADGGIFSWGGIAVKATCTNNALDIAITVAGKSLVDDAKYTIVTSDFLASGGDGVIGHLKLPEGSIKVTDVIMRDAMADVLRKKPGTTIEPEKIFNRAHPRLDLPSKRPVSCGAAVKESDPMTWSPKSWQTKPAQQQVGYTDTARLQGVLDEMGRLPPLVTSWEIENLRAELVKAARGDAFLLQGGDCAESFDDCRSEPIAAKLKILLQMSLVLVHGSRKPVIRVGRIAGQYAKPRSADNETRGERHTARVPR